MTKLQKATLVKSLINKTSNGKNLVLSKANELELANMITDDEWNVMSKYLNLGDKQPKVIIRPDKTLYHFGFSNLTIKKIWERVPSVTLDIATLAAVPVWFFRVLILLRIANHLWSLLSRPISLTEELIIGVIVNLTKTKKEVDCQEVVSKYLEGADTNQKIPLVSEIQLLTIIDNLVTSGLVSRNEKMIRINDFILPNTFV